MGLVSREPGSSKVLLNQYTSFANSIVNDKFVVVCGCIVRFKFVVVCGCIVLLQYSSLQPERKWSRGRPFTNFTKSQVPSIWKK